MRLGLIGDAHGDLHFLVDAINTLNSTTVPEPVDEIIQLGDFGYYPGHQYGLDFIEALNDFCAEMNTTLCFIEGNHDDHDTLARLDRDDLGRGVVASHIRHLPRGHTIVDDDSIVLAMGGAVSVNKDMLEPFESWWPTEAPSRSEIDAAIADVTSLTDTYPRSTIVLAHERPVFGTPIETGRFIRHDILADARLTQRELNRLRGEIQADIWVHGHHHHFATSVHTTLEHPHPTMIVGLGANIDRKREPNTAVLDTRTMDLTYARVV